jgi:energy-coupling factor transport system ATP-binding protein
MKQINGLNLPDKGEVLVNQRNLKDIKFSEKASEIGYVYQNPDHQIFNLTVNSEISFGPRHLGVPEEEINKRVDEVRSAVGLENLGEEYPFALGRGERQKLAVASVLVMNPPILIIDEPTTGLDWKGGVAMMNLIQGLHKQGHTIIMITHDMRIVSLYAHRVIVMAQGKILLDDTPRKVFAESEVLREAFLQPSQINRICSKLAENSEMPRDVLSVDEAFEHYSNLLLKGKENGA